MGEIKRKSVTVPRNMAPKFTRHRLHIKRRVTAGGKRIRLCVTVFAVLFNESARFVPRAIHSHPCLVDDMATTYTSIVSIPLTLRAVVTTTVVVFVVVALTAFLGSIQLEEVDFRNEKCMDSKACGKGFLANRFREFQ
jgi:hypothetical protein